MDKLLNILSELQIANEYISPEIDEIEFLTEKMIESIESYQKNCDEFQRKTKEIEELRKDEISLHNKIIDREREFAIAMEKLENLQSEYESLKVFNENELGQTENDLARRLENTMKMFGVDVQAQYVDPNTFLAKISFSKDKFVILKCEMIQNTHELQAMEPRHPHFEEIQSFLLETGDIVGFLCHVRKFFNKEV